MDFVGIKKIGDNIYQAAPYILTTPYELKCFNNPFSAIEYSILFEYKYFAVRAFEYTDTKPLLDIVIEEVSKIEKCEVTFLEAHSQLEARDHLYMFYEQLARHHNSDGINKIIKLRALKWIDFQF